MAQTALKQYYQNIFSIFKYIDKQKGYKTGTKIKARNKNHSISCLFRIGKLHSCFLAAKWACPLVPQPCLNASLAKSVSAA
jgi:hypothetical protein